VKTREGIEVLTPSDVRILRTSEVLQTTGLSRTSVWRLERAGKFPARRRITSGAVGWRSDEVQQWVTSRSSVSTEAA
jgi:predicted DNA-binding transcriptional regulator AlpA